MAKNGADHSTAAAVGAAQPGGLRIQSALWLKTRGMNDTGTLNFLWSQALVAGFVAAGCEHAVLSPGSRSTPLALAMLRQPGLDCTVAVDERCAAFFALGIAKASAAPGAAPGHLGNGAGQLAAGGDRSQPGGGSADPAVRRPPARTAGLRRQPDHRPARPVRPACACQPSARHPDRGIRSRLPATPRGPDLRTGQLAASGPGAYQPAVPRAAGAGAGNAARSRAAEDRRFGTGAVARPQRDSTSCRAPLPAGAASSSAAKCRCKTASPRP